MITVFDDMVFKKINGLWRVTNYMLGGAETLIKDRYLISVLDNIEASNSLDEEAESYGAAVRERHDQIVKLLLMSMINSLAGWNEND